jgi:hypothetical protein
MRAPVLRHMEHGVSGILDAGPRELPPRSRTMLSMQSPSPIRRYVLLRHRGHDASASRWSLERIAPAQRGMRGVPAAQPAKAADARV